MSEETTAVRGPSPGTGWRAITHGVHVQNGDDLPIVGRRRAELAGWQLLLPAHGCFTHLTAAAQRGWWLPPLPEGLPVFVCMSQGDPRPLRAGIRTLRPAHPVAFDVLDGVRVATPLEVLLACARDLCLLDMVVLLDGASYAGDIDLNDLCSRLSSMSRRRGLLLLRRALALADSRSESPWETLLRLLLVVCGIAVRPQYVVPGHLGALARADLWVVGTRTLQEFDGEVHCARAQQKRDLRRLRRLDREGWTRHGYSDDDVLYRAIGILRDADAALGREHHPERIRAWHGLVKDSLFSAAGRAAFLERVAVRRSA